MPEISTKRVVLFHLQYN